MGLASFEPINDADAIAWAEKGLLFTSASIEYFRMLFLIYVGDPRRKDGAYFRQFGRSPEGIA
ncbi:MAG: hypothetical protein WBM76_15985 [Woeseiaceae bacterium]